MSNRVKIILILLGALSIALLMWWRSEMHAQDVKNKVGEMKSYCIGRYVIDVPDRFEMIYPDASIGLPRPVRVIGLGPLKAAQLPDYVAGRIEELRAGVEERGVNFRYAGASQLGDIQLVATEKYNPYLTDSKSRFINVEAYYVRHGHLFRARADVFDTLDEVAHLGDGPQQVGLSEIADATWPRENDVIPSQPGICADRALIDLPVVNDMASAGFKDPDAFGVGMSFDTSEQRAAQVDIRENWLFGMVGARAKIAGISGRAGQKTSHRDRILWFEAHGVEGGAVGEPSREVRLELFKNDVDLDAEPYPVAEMEAIWEAVLPSVRRR
ncbi:hypothetical protein DFP89_1615 [Paracoccus lutimaris]|uniref:Uncharacterized protein n=3 Tax=Paracoccus lutimaris TaxID=1490030 RepID=A0A368YC81_9RHOB|nr:hypothetical protein DFP89_1615 [Paracoccus lutimaris]